MRWWYGRFAFFANLTEHLPRPLIRNHVNQDVAILFGPGSDCDSTGQGKYGARVIPISRHVSFDRHRGALIYSYLNAVSAMDVVERKNA